MVFLFPDGADHAARPPAGQTVGMRCATCGEPIFNTAHIDLFVHAHNATPSKRRETLCAVCGLVRSSVAHHA